MNLFSSFILVTLLMLTIPIMMTNTDLYKSDKYSSYVKNTVSYAFITSLILTMMFVHTGQEMVISNWHWITIQTLKLTLSFKMDYFSMMFMPVALSHGPLWSSQYNTYTPIPTLTCSSNIYSSSSSPC